MIGARLVAGGILAAIVGLCLVIAQPPPASAFLGSFLAGAPAASSSGSACGSEAAPSQAVAAGLNTCVMNFDFTQTTRSTWLPSTFSGSDLVSALNWLDCAGTNTALPIHAMGGGVNNAPCPGSMSVVNDGGTQAFLASITTAQYNAGARNLQIATSANAFNGPATPVMPNQVWIQATARVNAVTPVTAEGGIFSWQAGSPAPSGGALAFNYYDGPQGNGYASGNTGNGNGGSPQLQGYFYWTQDSFLPGTCYQAVCTANIPAGLTSTSYFTYAMLLTNNWNGSSGNYYGCAFIRGSGSFVFQSCDFGGNAGNAAQFTYPVFDIIQLLMVGQPTSVNQMFVQSLKAWSCPAWQTSQCAGTTLVGSGGGSTLTYYRYPS